MRRGLPATPAEVLEISSALRVTANTVVKCAEVFKFWQYPYADAAASLEEMTLKDSLYWVYKSINPIIRPEKGEQFSELCTTNNFICGLPQGFEKHASMTLGAGGDILRCKGTEHSKDILFENVADLLFDQDISYANYESPITRQALVDEVIGDKGPPIECSSPEQFDIFKGHKGKNFDVLNISNNHSFDMGVEGLTTTQEVLTNEGILSVGINSTPEKYGRGVFITKNGIKIGFVSATFGLNGHQVPDADQYRINVAKLCSKFVEPEFDLLKQQLEDCKHQGCDFIIGSLHWGYEFEMFPRKHQMETAHQLVEMGVDAIIAHHPHVIQPVEYYRTRRDPERIAVIAYSMGSLTWGFSAPHIVLSIILNLHLSKGWIGGRQETYIEDATVTPVFRSVVDSHGKLLTRIEKLTDHIGSRSNVHPQNYISRIEDYVDLILGNTL